MKRDLFIILVSTLFILTLMYLYDKVEVVLNREYQNTTDHVHIEYPYFHNQIIDNYINIYLNNYIEKNGNNSLFIDYDYTEKKQNIELTIYIYEKNEGIIKEKQKTFSVNLTKGTIQSMEYVKENKVYDIYYQKIIDKNKPMIALTFDDGPNHNTAKILTTLEKYHIKATFFILGCNIEGNEKVIKKMSDLNMEIGNHMYSHKLLTKLTSDEITKEIKKVDNLIFEITGKNPTLIRPSYGSYNNRIKKIMDRPIIIWNIDTLDWKYHNSKKIYKRVMKSISDGDIILMHDIYNATANSLELIIPELLKEDYQFVTVSELLYYKEKSLEKGKVYSNAN